jgi:cell division septation protein DedD
MATFLLMLGLAYGGGFLTAWYLYRPAAQAKGNSTGPAAPRQQASLQAQPAAPAAPKTGQDVPLSFYENLQKGNKSIIGSGLNPQKGQEPVAAKPPTPPPSNPQPAAKKLQEPAQPQGKPSASTTSTSADEGQFAVQVASTKERKEAEELLSRLKGKGYAAVISESKVEGKGTWFRVRVGKRLSRADAEDLAARLKSGSVVVQDKQ